MNKRIALFLTTAAVVVLCFSNVMAAAEIGFNGIGGRLALVDPEDIDATIGFGVFVDLGTITPDVHLEAGIDYWGKSMDLPFDSEVKFRDIILGARAKYVFSLENSNLKPFAGGGLAIHLFHSEIDLPSGGSTDDSETRIGLDLGGGVAFALNEKADVTAEGWYRIVSDVSQLVLQVGVLYHLGE